jgi:hypothetical protein
MGAPLSDITGREKQILSPNAAAPKEENSKPLESKTPNPQREHSHLLEAKQPPPAKAHLAEPNKRLSRKHRSVHRRGKHDFLLRIWRRRNPHPEI